jgi:acyl phosphate:glycerol-3-phosphate acyltransferase
MNLLICYVLLAYFVGSISCAITVSKLLNLPDPRENGSNNPGATNMLRTSGKLFGLITLLGDLLKGFILVFFVKYLGFDDLSVCYVAFAAFLGHLYPVYYGFKGGKGVAITLGLLLAINYQLAILALLIWLLVFYLFKYSSLAALIAVLASTFIAFFFYNQELFWLMGGIAFLSLFKHRNNIVRLINKTEGKIKA